MNMRSFEEAQLIQEYLTTTGDILNTNVCRAFGLPMSKHFLHDLRVRLGILNSLPNIHFGNPSADELIVPDLSLPARLIWLIETIPDDTFTSSKLELLANVKSGTVLKALQKLENESVIERVQSTRPHKWRRCPNIRPDFTKIFMEVHGLIDPISSVSLGQIVLLANRALCGMPINGVSLPSLVTDLTSRYARISLSIPPHRALEPFLLAVLKGAGDYRAVTRELDKALREAKTIRRAFDRLPRKEGSKSPLEDYTLPAEWISIFELPGISSFVEAVTVSLGSELHPKEAEWVADEAIEEAILELMTEGILLNRDRSIKYLLNVQPTYYALATSIIEGNIQKNAKRTEVPIRKVNIKKLYRTIAWEILGIKNFKKNNLL